MELILSTDKKTEIKMSAPKSTISISGAKGTKNHQTLYNLDYENSGHTGFQKELTFDDTPTANSDNPVKSGGIKTELDKKANTSDVYTKAEADTELDKKANLENSKGGFEGGNGTHTTTGGAIGKGAFSQSGGAVGKSAMANSGGGAVGENAFTYNGFAGGYNAKTGVEASDAIQLGTGTNNNMKTLQVYDYQLLDANGHIPNDRMPTKADRDDLNDYVKNTDYANNTDFGIVKIGPGLQITASKSLAVSPAGSSAIAARSSSALQPIVPANLNLAVKSALSDEKRISDMTDSEKANARDVIGAISQTELDKKADKSASIPHTTVSGYPIALTDHLGGENVLDYKIYGNSVQNGTPTADAPVAIQSVGDLVTDTASEHYGKYDIPITLCGDNLFDMETILPEQGWTKQEDGSFYVAVNRTVYQKKLWENTEGYTGRLKIDYRVKFQKGKAESGAGSSIRIIYTDGTAENVLLTLGTWEANQWIVPDYHVYSNANKTVDYLDWVYGTGGNPTWVKDIIITKNLSATYEPFSGGTEHIYLDEPLRKAGTYADCIDVKAQKVIRNVSVTDTTGTKTIEESLAGAETPTEESAVIPSLTMPVSAAANMTVKTTVAPSKADLEYYQDINKVIAEIKAAILSNGGNV